MSYISIQYDLPLPNQFLVDHSHSQGKTRKAEYHGPDKIYLYIGEDGRENHGPVTAEDLADGRPCPADAKLFEVDCTKHPLICQLRAPIMPDLQEVRSDDQAPHPGSPKIPGYPQYMYSTHLLPEDIYDRWSVRVVNSEPTIEKYSAMRKLIDKETPLTWDDIRDHRDKMLSNSDSAVAEDMPESIKNKWKVYRQKLRDLPAVMQAAGVEPTIAYYMFPYVPGTEPEGYVED